MHKSCAIMPPIETPRIWAAEIFSASMREMVSDAMSAREKGFRRDRTLSGASVVEGEDFEMGGEGLNLKAPEFFGHAESADKDPAVHRNRKDHMKFQCCLFGCDVIG